MNQNFSKSKVSHESSKLEHFQSGVKILKVKVRGVGSKNFGPVKSFGFNPCN